MPWLGLSHFSFALARLFSVFQHLNHEVWVGLSLQVSCLEFIKLLQCVDCFSLDLGSFLPLFLRLRFLALPLSSLSSTPITWMLVHFGVSCFSEALSIYLHSSFLCFSDWIIFIDLSSSLLILLLAQIYYQITLMNSSFQLHFSTPEFPFGSFIQYLSLHWYSPFD